MRYGFCFPGFLVLFTNFIPNFLHLLYQNILFSCSYKSHYQFQSNSKQNPTFLRDSLRTSAIARYLKQQLQSFSQILAVLSVKPNHSAARYVTIWLLSHWWNPKGSSPAKSKETHRVMFNFLLMSIVLRIIKRPVYQVFQPNREQWDPHYCYPHAGVQPSLRPNGNIG